MDYLWFPFVLIGAIILIDKLGLAPKRNGLAPSLPDSNKTFFGHVVVRVQAKDSASHQKILHAAGQGWRHNGDTLDPIDVPITVSEVMSADRIKRKLRLELGYQTEYEVLTMTAAGTSSGWDQNNYASWESMH